MNGARRDPVSSQRYEIRLRGHLGEAMQRAFPALQAEIRNEDTLLRGALADQSALHGVLAQIEALGLELLELRRLLSMAAAPGRAGRRRGARAARTRPQSGRAGAGTTGLVRPAHSRLGLHYPLALPGPGPCLADNRLEGAGDWDGEHPGCEDAEEPGVRHFCR